MVNKFIALALALIIVPGLAQTTKVRKDTTVSQGRSEAGPEITIKEIHALLRTPVNARKITFRGQTAKLKSNEKFDYFDLMAGKTRFQLESPGDAWSLRLAVPRDTDWKTILTSLELPDSLPVETVHYSRVVNRATEDYIERRLFRNVPALGPSYVVIIDAALPGPLSVRIVSMGKLVFRPNLLQEPKWQHLFLEGAEGTFELKDGVAHLEVTRRGSNPWSGQMSVLYGGLVDGKRYALSFRARSDGPLQLLMIPRQLDPPYAPCAVDKQFLIDAQYTSQYVEFEAKNATGKVVRIPTICTLDGEPHSLWVTDVTLRELP